MQDTLDAIAQPRRREILRLIGRSEMNAGEIASHFRVTRPAISQHLTVLKRAGLVTERREGTKRIYALRPEGLAELRTFIDQMWGGGLDALKREAELEERRRRAARRDRRR
jgi:DNA-binding transcriptional ArsR family regulator